MSTNFKIIMLMLGTDYIGQKNIGNSPRTLYIMFNVQFPILTSKLILYWAMEFPDYKLSRDRALKHADTHGPQHTLTLYY